MATIDLRSWQLKTYNTNCTIEKIKKDLINYAKEDIKWEFVAVPKTFVNGSNGFEIYTRLKNPIYVETI